MTRLITKVLAALLRRLNNGPEEAAEHHLARGEAYRLRGENEKATACYQQALRLSPDLDRAYIGLSQLRMAGESYDVWLHRMYAALAPKTLIEIGVGEGGSITQLQPPALAIGVDPAAKIIYPIKAETHIFPETSDGFFKRRGPDALLAGRILNVGFIDGLHLFEQALRDFIHLESYCGPGSVIIFHDTIPFDETTQSRTQVTAFYTGDVWKTVLCLRHYRPELDIFTIATPPSGLTVVTGMDPKSRTLPDHYETAVGRFVDMPYADIVSGMDAKLNIVPNDYAAVEARLRSLGIL